MPSVKLTPRQRQRLLNRIQKLRERNALLERENRELRDLVKPWGIELISLKEEVKLRNALEKAAVDLSFTSRAATVAYNALVRRAIIKSIARLQSSVDLIGVEKVADRTRGLGSKSIQLITRALEIDKKESN